MIFMMYCMIVFFYKFVEFFVDKWIKNWGYRCGKNGNVGNNDWNSE